MTYRRESSSTQPSVDHQEEEMVPLDGAPFSNDELQTVTTQEATGRSSRQNISTPTLWA